MIRPAPLPAGAGVSIVLGLVGIAAAALAWQVAVWLIGNPGLFPSIPQIGRAFAGWAQSGALLEDISESLPRALLAIALAAPLGVLLGLVLGLSRTMHGMFNGLVQLLRCLPPVALLPLFILWFGIDWDAKLYAAIFVCLFPIAVTTYQATTLLEKGYRELATDLRLRHGEYISKIIVPGALPQIVPGLRLAAGTSFIMVFVSELGGASAGLGYRISIAQLAYQADLMLAGLLVLGLAGLATDMLITRVSTRLLHYAGR